MIFFFFGDKFICYLGIICLMEDFNDGLCMLGVIMLGGGNFVQILEMNDYFQQLLVDMLDNGKVFDVFCNYDGLQGKSELLVLLVNMLCDELGWEIELQNIVLINGSQSVFFYLFNLFVGCWVDGIICKVLFLLMLEYIGYVDVGLEEDLFVVIWLNIELLLEGQFKYYVDFEYLQVMEEIGMICVLCFINLIGNVIIDEELIKLDVLVNQYGVLLVIDNVYGVLFLGIIFSDV